MRKAQRVFTQKSARLWFLGTVIAMVGITIGAAFAASALVPHAINQQTSGFQSNFADVPAFTTSSATLTAAFAPATITTCTTPGTSTSPIPITSTPVTSYYNATTNQPITHNPWASCEPGNFSEVFSIQTVAANAGKWIFTFSINSSSSVSAQGHPVYTDFIFSTFYSTTASTTVVTLTIYLEFGAFIPVNGVQAVTLLVTPA